MNNKQAQPVINVVDDDEEFQIAISRLLRAAGYNVRTFTNAGEFLLADIGSTPGCILLDICMPGPSGLDLQQALTKQHKHLPIIFLTGYGSIPASVKAIKAGAVDFLTKPVEHQVLFNAINNALDINKQERAINEQLATWRLRYQSLTRRELEVFEGIIAGKRNKVIADDLGMAERTVKAHRARVMEKMGSASLAELVHIADQLQDAGVLKVAPSSRTESNNLTVA